MTRELLTGRDDPRGTIVATTAVFDCSATDGVVVRGWSTDTGEDIWQVRTPITVDDLEVPAGDCRVFDDERRADLLALLEDDDTEPIRLEAGQMVIFVRPVERWPFARVPAGTLGAVVSVDGHLIEVRPCGDFPGLQGEDWNGCVHWYGPDVPDADALGIQHVRDDLRTITLARP